MPDLSPQVIEPFIEIQPNTASQSRGLYTPKAKQIRVIAASLAGQSNRAIARQQHLNRFTVGRILAQPDVSLLVEYLRQQMLISLAPAAIRVLERKLREKNVDWRMAISILKGVQVLDYRTPVIVATRDEFKNRSSDELQFASQHGYWPEDAPRRS